uniref:Uncharacterized protein n=1 Tax=Anguilla anguilla TaxID=7936 RepID=A0A0E9X5H9_ANGAN
MDNTRDSGSYPILPYCVYSLILRNAFTQIPFFVRLTVGTN